MGDSIQKITIAETNINIYDVVAYHIKDKTLVVFTVGETLYFNEPGDIEDVEVALAELDTLFDSLSTNP